ncbi:MAG: M48 family metalloprotease [Alphaproteobacteria bacterium]|nr:M48 family metalloprotease [Alphaproteobacteria bacterium]
MPKIFHTVLIVCFIFIQIPAHAISVIRDTETEGVILTYIRQIFKAAGLNPNNAQVVLVNDSSINAFVAGGQAIFVHSGLITTAKTVDDLIFVLAHETGHIVGGHIVRGQGIYSKARTTALISTILGGLVAVAGRPDAGLAVMMGGATSASGIFTAYQQTEESAADRTAVDILKKTNYSLKGFENTMSAIQAQERLSAESDFSYLRTHPLTKDRIKALERFTKNAQPTKEDIRFELIKAKLIGFLYDPKETFSIYQHQSDMPADYARSIALYRSHQFNQSQLLLDKLIAQKPDYPYFYELKAQFYLETGDIDNAIRWYRKTVQMMPNAPLIQLSLAQALLQNPTEQTAKESVPYLKYVLSKETDTPLGWQLLATAYEQTGNQQEIPYVMAEYYRTLGDLKSAKKMAQKALKTVPQGTPSYIRSQDIIALPENKRY